MALEVIWTKRAETGYDKIIKYLKEEWTDKEIRNFFAETRHFLEPPVRRQALPPSNIFQQAFACSCAALKRKCSNITANASEHNKKTRSAAGYAFAEYMLPNFCLCHK